MSGEIEQIAESLGRDPQARANVRKALAMVEQRDMAKASPQMHVSESIGGGVGASSGGPIAQSAYPSYRYALERRIDALEQEARGLRALLAALPQELNPSADAALSRLASRTG